MKKSCVHKGIAVRAASVALAVTLLGAMFVPMAGAASDKAAVTATVHIRNMPSTSGKSFGTVSYTHLDVYKRQAMGLAVAFSPFRCR